MTYFVLPIPRGLNFYVPVLRKAGLPAYCSGASAPFPVIPVGMQLPLTKYGDEFVQDSHLFPFSPVRSFFPQIILNPSDWHLTQSWLNLLCNLNTVAQIMSILSRSSELKHPLRNSKKPSSDLMSNKGLSYVREKIRTPDLLVRSQTLYPAELRAHIIFVCLSYLCTSATKLIIAQRFLSVNNFFKFF